MAKVAPFESILVPVDGSVPSLVAEEIVILTTKKFRSKVTLLHVASHELMHPELQRFSPRIPEYIDAHILGQGDPMVHVPHPSGPTPTEKIQNEITSWYLQKGEEILASAVNLFKQEGIAAEREFVEHSDAADTILRRAEKGGHDLIVMGRNGGDGQDTHLGSVAEKVSRNARIPVLVASNRSQVKRILVPVDGTENSRKATMYAGLLASKIGADLTLMHVQESTLFSLKPKVTEEIGRWILDEASRQVGGVQVEQRLEVGNPAKIIAEKADQGYDLIVMGSRGRGLAARFTLGSVSNHVLQYASSSILIAR